MKNKIVKIFCAIIFLISFENVKDARADISITMPINFSHYWEDFASTIGTFDMRARAYISIKNNNNCNLQTSFTGKFLNIVVATSTFNLSADLSTFTNVVSPAPWSSQGSITFNKKVVTVDTTNGTSSDQDFSGSIPANTTFFLTIDTLYAPASSPNAYSFLKFENAQITLNCVCNGSSCPEGKNAFYNNLEIYAMAVVTKSTRVSGNPAISSIYYNVTVPIDLTLNKL